MMLQNTVFQKKVEISVQSNNRKNPMELNLCLQAGTGKGTCFSTNQHGSPCVFRGKQAFQAANMLDFHTLLGRIVAHTGFQ